MNGKGALCRNRAVLVLLVLVAAMLWLTPTTANAALAWSAPSFLGTSIAGNPGIADLACPTSSECVAVDSDGREVSFDPAAPSGWSAYSIDGKHGLTGVSCPAASECVAVDRRGNEITFDPGRVGATPQSFPIDPGNPLAGVSCPTARMCAAVGVYGWALTFDPQAPTSAQAVPLGGGPLLAVDCPSAAQCTALDSGATDGWTPPQPERMVTFNPQAAATVAVSQVPSTVLVTTLMCPTTGECIGAGSTLCPQVPPGTPLNCVEGGATVTFDPAASGDTPVTVRGAVYFLDLACESASVCTAMDGSGTEVTFDPGGPGVLEQAAVDPIGDYGKGLNGSRIACLPTGGCVLATTTYESAVISFNPLSPGVPTPVPIDDGAPISAFSCPAAGECIALATAESEYSPGPSAVTATFDSSVQSHLSATGLLLGAARGVACPKPTQCTAVATQTAACGPCLARGTTVEVTFDPYKETGGGPPFGGPGIRIDKAAVAALACPTARQCSVVDQRGREVTFDPVRPRERSTYPETRTALTAIGCPSATQCTAVGKKGIAVTFAPGSGSLITGRRIDGHRTLAAVSCPTAGQCSAVDETGREITFDPRITSPLITQQIGKTALTAIACPSRRMCVAVTASGQAATGNPETKRSWSIEAVPGATSLLTVACISSRMCVAGDSAGDAFEAVPSSPS